MTAPAEATSPEQIRDWLTERVAAYLECPATIIRPDVPLVSYGMDSLYAVSFIGDIGLRFGVTVEETLAWDYPTIEAITSYLDHLLRTRTDAPEAADRERAAG